MPILVLSFFGVLRGKIGLLFVNFEESQQTHERRITCRRIGHHHILIRCASRAPSMFCKGLVHIMRGWAAFEI